MDYTSPTTARMSEPRSGASCRAVAEISECKIYTSQHLDSLRRSDLLCLLCRLRLLCYSYSYRAKPVCLFGLPCRLAFPLWERQPEKPPFYEIALNASSRSSMISSIFSVPIERRIVLGLIPCSTSSFSFNSEWVVLAG